MIVVLEKNCSLKHKAGVVRFIERQGGRPLVTEIGEETHIGLIGGDALALTADLAEMPGVAEIRATAPPYPQVSREHHPEPSEIRIGDLRIGGDEVVVMAGPCSVESQDQLSIVGTAVARAGARMLRGGAFKPRSSPYSFQGLGEEGLVLLAQAREETGLPVITEVVAPEDVGLVARYADILQIGARNMQNFRLLSEVGAQARPVLLKRGISSTIEEFLLAAEYVVSAGNPRVVLCERGIRTFETTTRNTLDVSAVPVLKQRTHLPVIVDPSHAAGERSLVPHLARAAVAAGADGVIVEVHNDPDLALSDGKQSLTLEGFSSMMDELRRVAAAVDRYVSPPNETVIGPNTQHSLGRS
ncbi:MAG: 3-deoxy-7-phosphoheptulonate synthase [Gammaproteobacteria bacterium]|nr:3-deoxy-7-phosphoheptulonate synthase [Gammaproteobacteria bacterium]